uniref:Uncharacterized protein n=1 Tax=Rousettus aegyptiacus TaxID=9407 RepID=A0A7J8CHH8_ROUAE|nr:hypothetical protein HJG63_008909 [Rousettus aegyptiacus]
MENRTAQVQMREQDDLAWELERRGQCAFLGARGGATGTVAFSPLAPTGSDPHHPRARPGLWPGTAPPAACAALRRVAAPSGAGRPGPSRMVTQKPPPGTRGQAGPPVLLKARWSCPSLQTPQQPSAWGAEGPPSWQVTTGSRLDGCSRAAQQPDREVGQTGWQCLGPTVGTLTTHQGAGGPSKPSCTLAGHTLCCGRGSLVHTQAGDGEPLY